MAEHQCYTTIPAFMATIRQDDVRRANPVTQLLERSKLSRSCYFDAIKTDGSNLRVDTLQRLCEAYGAKLVIIV